MKIKAPLRCVFVACIGLGAMAAEHQAFAQSEQAKELDLRIRQLFAKGNISEVIPMAEQLAEAHRQSLGENHPSFAIALDNLAVLYAQQGRSAEAESLHKRALVIKEAVLGPEHPSVATTLNNLASLYDLREAEPLFRRALAIRENALGPNHPLTAASLNNLALAHMAEGRTAEAEPLFKRALEIVEQLYGPNFSEVALHLHNLARVYERQGAIQETESLLKRALQIDEDQLGRENPRTAQSVLLLAEFYGTNGHIAEAESLYARALSILEKEVGPEHLRTAGALAKLAQLRLQQMQWQEAMALFRRSANIQIRHERSETAKSIGDRRSADGSNQHDPTAFSGFINSAYRVAIENRDQASKLREESFPMGQRMINTAAAASLVQMALRQAKGDGALARLVRERQDLVVDWRARDKLLVAVVSQPPEQRNALAEQEQRTALAAINTRIGEIDLSLANEFPEYASFASPQPLAITDVQLLLHNNEALLLFIGASASQPIPDESYLWVVTKTDARWMRIEPGTRALTGHVAALRCGLDHTLWDSELVSESAKRCKAALGAEPSVEMVKIADKDANFQVLPFDVDRAHTLYKALFGPVEDLIKGKHLLIVPSEPLTSLPFNVLVTELPTMVNATSKLSEYRTTAWLGARQPIMVLPSVASLKALRQLAKTSHATKAYLGIGNPLLDGPDARSGVRAEMARAKQQCPKSPWQGFPGQVASGMRPLQHRGGLADVASVRAQEPLPETADELCAVARDLGVPESDIRLGTRATERDIKALSTDGSLSTYRIVHFATHGALAREAKEILRAGAEPGLILTPPGEATLEDDGYLSASEIATLRLDADWVILSACNTAGSSGETVESLSGIARAFFYAGARALLVSHWEVGSDASVKLITRAFTELKANPKIGRAEAFRLSMLELIEKGSLAEAQPSQWAPFVVVGEGGEQREVVPVATSPIADPTPTLPTHPKGPKKAVNAPDWRREIWR